MRILMIGNETLLNDGIQKNLISRDEFEVHHIAPQHIDRHDFKSPRTKFKLTLIDVSSFPGSPAGCIRRIVKKEPSDYLVALHNDYSNSSIQKLLDSGINRCLPLDTDTDKLIEIVSQFRNNIDY